MLVVGAGQAEYMARIRGADRERCLVVPVDVGKRSAMALVADHCHEVVVAPFEFDLTDAGVAALLEAADQRAFMVGAVSVRFGVESAGHYHRGLVARLDELDRDVVELNPAVVKDARGRIGHRRVKTDVQDCLAMAEVLIDGLGHAPVERDVAMATQAAWAGQRRRRVAARSSLARQIHAQVDLAFPHLTACYSHGLNQRSLRVIMSHICDPQRIVRLGPKRLAGYVSNRGVRMTEAKAVEVVEAARQTLLVSDPQRQAAQAFVARDMALLESLEAEIAEADRQLESVLHQTPAGVLASIPGVGVIAASYYGAALGDPWRFRNANAAYRYSGLSPTSYESAGKASGRQRISREGSVHLRSAIVTLGRGMALHEPEFGGYYKRLTSAGKPPLVALIATGHRAHRLAFAMCRNQTTYDPEHWIRSVERGRAVKATKVT